MYKVQRSEMPGGRKTGRQETRSKRLDLMQVRVNHNFFAAWRLCANKKKELRAETQRGRRGGLDFKTT